MLSESTATPHEPAAPRREEKHGEMTSPSGHETPGTLEAYVKMHRLNHDGAFLIVEGADDIRFWRTRRHRSCDLVNGENKNNVVGGVRALDALDIKGVLGIVDSDYDTFTGWDLGSPNLVATDACDLDCVLCRSSALDAVLAERGDAVKIERFEKENGISVRNALLDRALVFGRVRLAATLHGDSEIMKVLRVPRFLPENTWDVDVDGLMEAVAGRSNKERDTWEERVARLLDEDPWFVTRGHDLIEVLRIGLKNALGTMTPRDRIGSRDLPRELRLAFDSTCLQATGLWTEMRAWEEVNQPFKVLGG